MRRPHNVQQLAGREQAIDAYGLSNNNSYIRSSLPADLSVVNRSEIPISSLIPPANRLAIDALGVDDLLLDRP